MKIGSSWDFKLYQEKEWFRFLGLSLLLLALLYMLLHLFFCPHAGYEYSKLDEKQIQQINRIYFDSAFTSKPPKKAAAETTDSVKKVQKMRAAVEKPAVNKSLSESLTDSGKIKDSIIIGGDIVLQNKKTDSCSCVSKAQCERVIQYLKTEFSNKIDTLQIDSFRNYLCSSMPLEATSFLANMRLRVRSYFWLTGPEVYLEIVLWTLFGVLCSLLFNLGVIGKNSTTNPTDRSTYFDASEIPYQIAKLLYAPLCTLVIILGYNFFNNQNIVDISSSKGIIVFSFIGGFYSSRMISLLDRLKDVLFPNSGTASNPVIKDQPPLKNIIFELEFIPKNTNMLTVQELALATVILQNSGTKEEFKAININQNLTPLFIADYIKPDNYIATATYQKGEMKFIGTQVIEMKTADIFVIIKLEEVLA